MKTSYEKWSTTGGPEENFVNTGISDQQIALGKANYLMDTVRGKTRVCRTCPRHTRAHAHVRAISYARFLPRLGAVLVAAAANAPVPAVHLGVWSLSADIWMRFMTFLYKGFRAQL
jgi:hypothetical protein